MWTNASCLRAFIIVNINVLTLQEAFTVLVEKDSGLALTEKDAEVRVFYIYFYSFTLFFILDNATAAKLS